MDVKHCSGCADDFYNGKNPLGVKKCWMRDKARLATKFRIHRDSMPGWKGAFTEVLVPNCYRGQGFVHYEKLPDFVKRENVNWRRKEGAPKQT
jgi:hypothetical protein